MAPLPCSSSSPPLTTETSKAPPLSAVDRTDRLLKSLGVAVSDHPLLKPFISLHSQLRNLFQVHFRVPRAPHSSLVMNHNFAAILPGDSVAGLVVANGINNFLNLYNTVLVVRLVLTWFPNAPPAIVSPLSTVCDPYLNIFRGIIPPLGGLDLSPILAFLVLNVFTSSAAALPAELPASQHNRLSHSNVVLQDLTAAQEKWMKRLSSRSSRTNRS